MRPKGFGSNPDRGQKKGKLKLSANVASSNGESLTLPSGKQVYQRPFRELLAEINMGLQPSKTADLWFSLFVIDGKQLTTKSAQSLSLEDLQFIDAIGQRLRQEIHRG